MSNNRGLYAASISVFQENKQIDFEALERLIEYYVRNRFQGAFIVSSTGEYFSTEPNKRVAMTKAAVNMADKRLNIFTGISEDYIEGVFRNIDDMSTTYAQGFMLMPPRFQIYSQEELISFYLLAADYSPIPIYIYNHMSRLNNKLAVDTIEILSRHPNIMGIKDTHNDHMRLTEMLSIMGDREDFLVYSGGDAISGLACLMGGSILNALAPIVPDLFHAMIAAGNTGNVKETMRLQLKVNKLMGIFGVIKASSQASVASFSQGVKVAMSRHIPCSYTLSQLGVEVMPEDVDRIYKIVDEALET